MAARTVGDTADDTAAVEAALLGAILASNRAYHQVAGTVAAEHFASPAHRLVFQACADFIDRGRAATPLTLAPVLGGSPLLAEAGGIAYLYDLAANVVSVISAREYARAVHESWLQRRLVELCHAAAPAEGPAAPRIEALIEALGALAESGTASPAARPYAEAAADALAEIDRTRAGETVPGVETGFAGLDRLLVALMPGELTVLGGRPAMGKSALALNIAHNAAARGQPVYLASLEMKDRQLARRQLSAASGVAAELLRGNRAKGLSQEQMEALQRAARDARDVPLWFDDRAGLTIPQLRRRAEAVGRKARARRDGEGNAGAGLALVVVDYLQLLRPSAAAQRKYSDVAEVSEISRALKELALDLAVPVLALSQLSREVEKRQDRRPLMADLRQSGSIEQDADAVLFCYREEYYLERDRAAVDPADHEAWNRFEERLEAARGKAEVTIAKQRDGRTGTAELAWDADRQRFRDAAGEGAA
jgi:replicative DNA helicase